MVVVRFVSIHYLCSSIVNAYSIFVVTHYSSVTTPFNTVTTPFHTITTSKTINTSNTFNTSKTIICPFHHSISSLKNPNEFPVTFHLFLRFSVSETFPRRRVLLAQKITDLPNTFRSPHFYRCHDDGGTEATESVPQNRRGPPRSHRSHRFPETVLAAARPSERPLGTKTTRKTTKSKHSTYIRSQC